MSNIDKHEDYCPPAAWTICVEPGSIVCLSDTDRHDKIVDTDPFEDRF